MGERGRDGWMASSTQLMMGMSLSIEQTLVDSEGQGILAYCSSWGHKESDATERLKNTNTL